MQIKVERVGRGLAGAVRVPGDKSISHRGVLLGALGDGATRVRGFLDGADCRATVGVARGLGVRVETVSGTELVVHGLGLHGLRPPAADLDCQNSGTTMRLLTGLLAGQRFPARLVGTEQLQGRPMLRIVEPLRQMGARIEGRDDGRYAPLAIAGGRLQGIEYALPVASAQVKSCLLLAGLYAEGTTTAVEPGPCRDHTERLLRAMGAPLVSDGPRHTIERPGSPLQPLDLVVPGDVSSAAFLLVAAAIVPGSEVTIEGVGLNPTRSGIVEALRSLGAEIDAVDARQESGEPVADLVVRGASLRAAEFGGEIIVRMIDELPVLALAATQAEGRTVIRDAAELRVKETDRIESTAAELRKLGAEIETTPDGMIVSGPTALRGAAVDSQGDHRLAMTLTVAGLVAEGRTVVDNAHVVGDSFPGFEDALRALGAPIA